MIRNGPAFTCLFLLLSVFHQFRLFLFNAWFKRDEIWFDINTVIRLRFGGSAFRILAGKNILSSPKRPNQAHSPSYLMSSVGYTKEVKRLKSDCDHSLPSSTEVKNVWSYTSTHLL